MGWNRKTWGFWGLMMALPLGACSGTDQLVGSNGAAGGGGMASGNPTGGAGPDGNLTAFFTELLTDDTKCLPLSLPKTPTGDVACRVIVARSSPTCDCSAPGLSKTSADLTAKSQTFMQELGV